MALNPILKQEDTEVEEAEVEAIDELRAVLKEANVVAREIKAKTEKSIVQTTSIAESIISDINELGSTAQIGAKAKQTAQLQVQNANLKVLEAGGGHDIQVQLSRQQAEEGERLGELLNEKTDIMNDEFTGIGLIDQIINEFRSVQLDAEIESVATEKLNTDKQIQNLTASQEGFARVNTINTQTLSEAAIENNMEQIALTARLEASQTKIKNVHSNATLLASLTAANNALVSNATTLYGLDGEKRRQQLLTDAAKKREEEKLTDAEIVADIQTARSGMGLPKESNELVLRKFKDPISTESYHKLQELGNVVDPLGFTAGTNFSSSMDNFRLIDPDNTALPLELTPVVNDVFRAQTEIYEDLGDIPKDKASLDANLNATAKVIMDNHAKDIKAGSPLSAPPMTIIEKSRSVIDTAFYKNVIKPKGMVETNPQLIFDAAIVAMDAGTATAEETTEGIKAIFDAAVLYNNTNQGGFRRVGLPNQEGYVVTLENPLSGFAAFPLKLFKELGVAVKPENLIGTGVVEPGVGGLVGFLDKSTFIANDIISLFSNKAIPVDLTDETRIMDYLIKSRTAVSPAPPESAKDEE